MRHPRSGYRLLASAAIAAALAGVAADALAAATCYTVFDRQGEIVYRAFASPFPGAGDFTSPGRQAMRARGENLVFFDATYCPPVASVGGIGGRTYTTEEIVASFPGYAVRPDGTTIGSRYSMPTGATPVGGTGNDSVNVSFGSAQ